jgi:hypothetical protein
VLVKDFLKSETGVVKISEWIDVSELRNFLSHIAAHFNLTPYQVSDEEFLSELIIKSKGASGDVIRHMKILSLASNKLQGRLLTKDCLRAIWAY